MTNVKDWTDQEIIAHALGMWANYIETANIVLSAQDLRNIVATVGVI